MTTGSLGITTTTRRVLIVFGIVTALMLASAFVFASRSEAATKVVRIIDGDTLVLDMDGKRERVRILSIDTPETKDPNEPVECLGTAAAAFVAELLPVGTEVEPKYDAERRDRYGRLLAAVMTSEGESVAERVAAAGLGVPIQVGVNSAFYGGVRSALAEAEAAQLGFFDPAEECTVPAQQAATVDALTEASTVPPPVTPAEASSAIAQLVVAIAAGKALLTILRAPAKTLALAVLPATQLMHMTRQLQRAIARAELRQVWLTQRRNGLKAGIRRAKEERQRGAEERRRAEDERKRREAAAAASVAAAEAEDDDDDYSGGGNSGGGGDPYPGYTGPRCYEPGGVVWKPC